MKVVFEDSNKALAIIPGTKRTVSLDGALHYLPFPPMLFAQLYLNNTLYAFANYSKTDKIKDITHLYPITNLPNVTPESSGICVNVKKPILDIKTAINEFWTSDFHGLYRDYLIWNKKGLLQWLVPNYGKQTVDQYMKIWEGLSVEQVTQLLTKQAVMKETCPIFRRFPEIFRIVRQLP